MDIEPGTSSEADKSNTENACSKRKYKGGGTTCCIPTCSSNSNNSHITKFQLTKSSERCGCIGSDELILHQRVCSKHFVGGKKTCLHNVPTIVQKLLLPTQPKPGQNNI